MKITDRDRDEAISCAKMMGFPFMAAEIADGVADESALVQAIARTRLAAYEEAALVAETMVVGKPAYVREDHRKPKIQSLSRIAIAQAIRRLGEQ